MRKKIDILGSCVTRDAFEYANAKDDYIIDQYFARSSLISIVAPPIDINKESIELDSAFQQKTVYNDLNKIFRKHIVTSDSRFLIIDFIDERFNVLKYGNSFLTCSNEFNRSNLPKILDTVPLEKDDNYDKMWENAARTIVKDLEGRKPGSVILHRAYWKTLYRDKDGSIKKFPNQKSIDKNNQILERMYSLFEKISGDLVVSIQLPEDYIANAEHKWGLAPFHYEDQYYIEFIDRVKRIDKELEV